MQGGSELRPATAQFAGTMQGATAAGEPPGQKDPTEQSVARDTDPAAHPLPGRAVQAPLHAALVRFTTAP